MAKQTIAQRKKLKKAKPKPVSFTPNEEHYAYADGYTDGWEAAHRDAAAPSLWSRIKGWFK